MTYIVSGGALNSTHSSRFSSLEPPLVVAWLSMSGHCFILRHSSFVTCGCSEAKCICCNCVICCRCLLRISLRGVYCTGKQTRSVKCSQI